MTRWQYRLRPMNRGEYEPWHDVYQVGQPTYVVRYEALQFRRKPRRSPASLVGAVLRRAGHKQQRREA